MRAVKYLVFAVAVAASVLGGVVLGEHSIRAQAVEPELSAPAEDPVVLAAAPAEAELDAPPDPLEGYLRGSIYPPESQPLTEEMTDLLHPEKRQVATFTMKDDGAVEYELSADRYTLVGDEEAQVDLRAGEPVTIEEAYLVPGSRVEFREQARGEYRARIAPKGDEPALIVLHLIFRSWRGKIEHARLLFEHTPLAAVPARFTGGFDDHVGDGSLVITAGVEVLIAGRYRFDANLRNQDGKPIAWSTWTGELAAGQQAIALSFYGKAIRDRGGRAPFLLTELRGSRETSEAGPIARAPIPRFEGTHSTRNYRLFDFTDRIFDNAEKQETIRALESLTLEERQALRADPPPHALIDLH